MTSNRCGNTSMDVWLGSVYDSNKQLRYFGEEESQWSEHTLRTGCCDACILKSRENQDAPEDIKTISYALEEIHRLGLTCVTEKELLEWLE